jgi:hypothetical protein
MVPVVGQREITALELVAMQRPISTDARRRTVRPCHLHEGGDQHSLAMAG